VSHDRAAQGAQSRRDFLGAIAAGAMVGSLRLPRATPLGVQLYTVRGELERDFGGTLGRVARIGYKEVEFAGYFGVEAARVRALLDANGLVSPSSHVAIEALEGDFAAEARRATTIGQRTLIVPWLDTRALTTVAAWKGIAARLTALGVRARDAGLRIGFHNQAGDARRLADGTIPYDVLLGETDAGLVDYQMDCYWAITSGLDPVGYFQKHPGRFTSLHLKDATAAPEYAMRDLGAGAIDWRKILGARGLAGVRHLIVEHDDPRPDGFSALTIGYRYLESLTA